ncbi:MAG: hypothetical protein HYY06_03615 [Deltaproteobacteria bacterium]|nr:hypothetical protein [Deltaproteobacteria bacterium]
MFARAALVVSALAAAGCGGLELTIDVEASEIPANGSSSTRITVKSNAEDGSQIELSTDRGRFNQDAAAPEQYLSLVLDGGSAGAELWSDTVAGEATVSATVYDENGETKTASARVRFVGQRPASDKLSLECALVNVGALRVPAPQTAVPCILSARDSAGTAIDVASLDVGFLTEGGSVDPTTAFDEAGNVAYVYRAGGDDEPVDTRPISGEPSRPDDLGGPERNPRDGLATIVAYVSGAEEGFNDVNGNGVYEPQLEETFDDVGEPILDVDDDGQYDPRSGDRYFDADGDGEYTGPNGVRDEEVVAWTFFKILWTGPPHESRDTTRLEADRMTTSIPRGREKRIDVWILDENMNPVAALPNGYDLVSVAVQSDGYFAVTPDSTDFALANERGFEVGEDGTIVGGAFEPTSFFLLIENTAPEGDEYPAADYTVTATVYASPGLTLAGDSDYFTELDQETQALEPLLGTLE